MDFLPHSWRKSRPVQLRLPFGDEPRDLKPWVPTVLSLFIVSIGIFTAIDTALILVRTYSPVIYWDQWEYVDVALHSPGWPSLSRLWSQFGEPRLVVGRLAGFVDLRLFGGRNISLQVELCLVPVSIVLVLICMIRRSRQLSGAAQTAAAGFVMFCALCPVQIDDLTWYFEVGFVSVGLAAVTSFACAIWYASSVPADRHWISGPLAVALLAAFLAECGHADGLLVWPILAALGFSLRFPIKSRILIGMCGAAAVTMYFWSYHSPGGILGDPRQTIRHPLAIAEYVITYFATTWDSLLAPRSAGSVLSESLTVAAIIAAVVTVIRSFCRRQPKVDALRTFLAATMLFAISTAVITSLGRLNFGVPQAAGSRYQCVALLFWACFAILVLRWAAGKMPRNLILAAVESGLLVLMVVSMGRFKSYERIAAGRQIRLGRAYVAVTRNPGDSASASVLNPAVAMMPVWYDYLRSHNLGPDPRELEIRLPRPTGPAPIPNWAGHKVVAADRCTGWVDGFEPGVPETGVVVVTGWAWDREAGTPPQKVLFATPDGWIVGSGEMTIPREDVVASVKDVTDINTGWEGEATSSQRSKLRAFVVLRNTTSICPLPNEVTVP